MTDKTMDDLMYFIENLREIVVEDVIRIDREYFLERRGELVKMLEDFIKEIEDE